MQPATRLGHEPDHLVYYTPPSVLHTI
jgi:hypothetical protein